MSQFKDSLPERANSPLLSLFALFRPSTDCIRLTHTREGILLSQTIHMLISFRNTLINTPRMFNQIFGTL